MAAVSNYPQQPRGPQRLIYSGALGGAVKERTPSVLLCSLTMLNGLRSKTLGARLQIIPQGHAIVPLFPSFYFCVAPRPAVEIETLPAAQQSLPLGEKSIFSWFSSSFLHTRGGSDYKRRRWPSNIQCLSRNGMHCLLHFLRGCGVQSSVDRAAVDNNLSRQDDIKTAFDVKRCLEERVSLKVMLCLLPLWRTWAGRWLLFGFSQL